MCGWSSQKELGLVFLYEYGSVCLSIWLLGCSSVIK
jgi:hypothetical protein